MRDVLLKDSDRTVQKTHAFSVIKANHLRLYREILALFFRSVQSSKYIVCAQRNTSEL